MSNLIKIALFEIRLNPNNLFLDSFEVALKELASKLDDIDGQDTRVLDIYNQIETSIWFDSFDYQKDFSKDIIFEDTICFLLAKDMKFHFIEDKENRSINNMTIKPKQNPKISAHCIYFIKENKFLIEVTSSTPTEATLKRGLDNYTEYKNDISFQPIYREDILERLNLFVNNIHSMELDNINLAKYLKEDKDGELFNFLENPDTRISAKLSIESSDMRTRVVNFFIDTFHNLATRELNNIKITYKDENQKNDIIELYKNLFFLKIETEVYHEDLSDIKKKKQRIEYSKNIYKTMIEAYCDEDAKK